MFLSFIVPVYNTEQYIDECLQSLLNQDIPLQDYEIICVNDGSTDGSLSILQRYKQEYHNITVINQSNGGVCSARNAGLLAAKGEYIWYIDSDDLLPDSSLKQLQFECNTTKCDRLIVGNSLFVPDCTDPSLQNTSWKDSVVWRSLLRREFLLSHNLVFRYPELSFGEDALYLYEVKRALPKTTELSDSFYLHRVRPGSLSTEMSAAMETRRLTCTIREAQIMKAYYEEGGILEIETANRFMSFLWGALFRLSQMPRSEAKPFINELKQKCLFPYKRPHECTLTKCPEISRKDAIGKLLDLLYTNLSSRWGYCGMHLVYLIVRIKSTLFSHI